MDASGLGTADAIALWTLSVFFVLIALGYAALAGVAFTRQAETIRARGVAVAALCIGIPYVHHMAVRSDVHHVAQSIHPLLLGVLALPYALRGERARALSLAVALALCVASLCAMVPEQPAGQRWLARGTDREFRALDAHGDELWIDGRNQRRLTAVLEHVQSTVPPTAKLWLAPKLLGLYPVLGRTSPVWDIYPVWTADAEREQRMLDELSDVEWTFLDDVRIAGQELLGFSSAYPLVYRRFQQDFEYRSSVGG